MHPSEDWAETFAHYLHIRDTLQTADAYRVTTEVALPGPRTPEPGSMEAMIADWLPLSLALNQLNRSMGADDLYPFVLPPAGDGQARARARPRRAPVTDRELAAAAARAAARIALARQGDAGRVTPRTPPTDVVSEVDREAEARRDRADRAPSAPRTATSARRAPSRPGERHLGRRRARRHAELPPGPRRLVRRRRARGRDGALAAAVCDPVRGELFTAARGEGADLQRRADRRRRRRRRSTRPLVATFLHAPKRDLPGVLRHLDAPARRAPARVRMTGSGTLELAYVAAGRLHGWIQPATYRWDWVPGALLVAEAGGRAERTRRRARLVHRRRPGAVRGPARAHP